MKRYIKSFEYIQASTLGEVVEAIERGLKLAQCTQIDIKKKFSDHCEVSLTLPNGKSTTITVWYDYSEHKNGVTHKKKSISWDPSYSIDDDGNVYDSSGNFIGVVKIIQDTGETSPKMKKDWNLESIRTDSGDVIIDHPEKDPTRIWSDVVKTLEGRKIDTRS